MPLSNVLTTLPWPLFDTVIKVIAFVGALLLVYSILLEEEKRQDAVFMIGSLSLLPYAIFLGSPILIFLFTAMFLVSGREFLMIVRRKHTHSNELVEEYKHPDHK